MKTLWRDNLYYSRRTDDILNDNVIMLSLLVRARAEPEFQPDEMYQTAQILKLNSNEFISKILAKRNSDHSPPNP